MIIPQYSFLDGENDIRDLPETFSFLDDDEIGSGWFVLYDHGDEFFHGSYVTDYYTREITFADFREEIERRFDQVGSSLLDIELTISCDGDEKTIRFYVYKSDLQLFTQVWDVMFSSEIPTIVVGTAQESIEAQLLVNGKAIFSGTYYMYVKRANIYDLRSVIETYCRVPNLGCCCKDSKARLS